MPYSYEIILDKIAREGRHYRVRDPHDNRIATCFDEENARLIVAALNHMHNEPVEWSCGHVAGACCAECYRVLAARAHEIAEASLDDT